MFGLLLLLLLSRFSRVRFCATPKTTAHQAPPSLGFSRQEHGVGCHFLLQWMKMKSESQVAQSCPTLCEPMDCSLPGSFVHGIFQARVLEWGAIALFGLISDNSQNLPVYFAVLPLHFCISLTCTNKRNMREQNVKAILTFSN